MNLKNNYKIISLLIPVKKTNGNFYIWLQRRQAKDFLEGKLEFVGGKVEGNESKLRACLREVKEEVGIILQDTDLSFFKTYLYEYKDLKVELNCFLYEDLNKKFKEPGWVELSLESFKKVESEIPLANIQIFDDLMKRKNSNLASSYHNNS